MDNDTLPIRGVGMLPGPLSDQHGFGRREIPTDLVCDWGETGLANAGVSLSKMDAPKVGKSVFCSFDIFYHNFRISHSPTVFI